MGVARGEDKRGNARVVTRDALERSWEGGRMNASTNE